MVKTPAMALESETVRNYLQTLRDLISLEINEQPGVINVDQNGEIHWDEASSQIILPIIISITGHENLATTALQSIIQDTADLYFKEVGQTYHGAVRVETSTR